MEKEFFLNSDYHLAEFAKALAHPARVAILRILKNCRQCNCGDNCKGDNCKCGCRCGTLVNQLPFAQSTVSQHIKELKSAGLIQLKGRKGDYTINYQKLSEGLVSLLGLLDQINLNINNMEENKKCECGDNCQCGDNCECGDNCQCGENCQCGDECQCKK